MKTLHFFVFIISFFFGLQAYSLTGTLHVLSPMRILDPSLIEEFEKTNNCIVDVEFIGDKTGYESHLYSEIQAFDVVLADEGSLLRLTTANLLRSLPKNLQQKINNNSQIKLKTSLNSEVNTYVPLFVNPIGIAYQLPNAKPPAHFTMRSIVDSHIHPYWRQRIFVNSDIDPVGLAALATHEPLTHSIKISKEMNAWLKELEMQIYPLRISLELALMNQSVNAAVLFYADYLRYKNILSKLNFVIPMDGTYFTRFGIGWCLSSNQEKLAQKFIEFMIVNSAKFTKSNHLFDINYPFEKKFQSANLWQLYDESLISPSVRAQVLGRK